MLIECILKRPGPVSVPISNDVYEFRPDSKGRKVCEVWKQTHIDCFLAVANLYREVPDDDAGAAAAAAAKAPGGAPGTPVLIEIRGIGARLVEKLGDLGVTTVAQVAAWSPEDVASIDGQLNFKGRIGREKWVEQANQLLADPIADDDVADAKAVDAEAAKTAAKAAANPPSEAKAPNTAQAAKAADAVEIPADIQAMGQKQLNAAMKVAGLPIPIGATNPQKRELLARKLLEPAIPE